MNFGARALQPRTGDERQVEGGERAELAAESQGTVAALLLAHATDLVVSGIENRDLPIALDRQPPGSGEDRITGVILPAGAGGHPEIIRPPVVSRAIFSLRCRLENLCRCQRIGKLRAQIVHGVFQAVIKNVPHHGHAAAHPLAAAEFRAAELRHATSAAVDGEQHLQSGIGTEAVTLRDIADQILSCGSKGLHDFRKDSAREISEYAAWAMERPA